jgi:hypothetical protein
MSLVVHLTEFSVYMQDVCCQIWATLYDYPCLKSCPGLVQYVKDAVRLAWGLVNQVSILFNGTWSLLVIQHTTAVACAYDSGG